MSNSSVLIVHDAELELDDDSNDPRMHSLSNGTTERAAWRASESIL
jgi:hypothetical protein